MKRNQERKIFELSTVDLTLYKFVLPLMNRLREEGFDVVCGARNHGYLDLISHEGFKTYNIPISRNLNPISIIKSTLFLIRIFRREKVDILHVHTPIAAAIGRIAAFFSGVNIKLYTVHGFILSPRPYYILERFMARHFTDYMFTVNREDYDLALRQHFIDEDRLTNINSVGIDTGYFAPDRLDALAKDKYKADLNLDKDSSIIGYVGRIVRPKGVLNLIHAFLQVRAEYETKLLLIGPMNMDERADERIIEDINKLITDNGLKDDIILTGHREDIAELMSIMDIFVLPSYREGMPVSLLEAMSMERAVIGTNIRGVKEEISEESGLLYEPGDIEQLAKQLRYYLSDKAIRVRYGRNARQRVIDHFSIDKVLDRQLKVFNELKHE